MKKKILALVLGALMAVAASGCEKKQKPVEEFTEKDFEKVASDVEKAYNEENKKEEKQTEKSDAVISYSLLPEVENSKFSDGLVQIGDDVFKNGYAITYADFYAKYSDKYDFTASKGEELTDSPNIIVDKVEGVRIKSKKDPDLVMDAFFKPLETNPNGTNLADCALRVIRPNKNSNKALENTWVAHGLKYVSDGYTLDDLKEILLSEGFTEVQTESTNAGEFCMVRNLNKSFTVKLDEQNLRGKAYEMYIGIDTDDRTNTLKRLVFI